MRLQQYLNEEYKGRVSLEYTNDTVEVFKNPTSREMREYYSVRFIADSKDKCLWIWDVNGALHEYVWIHFKELNKGRTLYSAEMKMEVLTGVAEVHGGGKGIMSDCNNITYETKEEDIKKLQKNMKWLTKIDINNFIERYC